MQSAFRMGVSTVDPEITSPEQFDVSSYKKCLNIIKSSGFKYVEYSHVHHLSEEDMEAIAEYAVKLGLKSYSVHGEGHIKKYGEEKFLELQSNCARNARILGCEIIVFHLPYPEGAPNIGENIVPLKKLVDIAANENLIVGLENGPVEIICEIIEKINMPNLKSTLDTGHAFRDGYDVLNCIKKMAPHLVHTHIADNFGVTDDHLPPGIGLINWPGVISELKNISYQGVLMVELTSSGMKKKRSIESLKKLELETELDVAYNSLSFLNK